MIIPIVVHPLFGFNLLEQDDDGDPTLIEFTGKHTKQSLLVGRHKTGIAKDMNWLMFLRYMPFSLR